MSWRKSTACSELCIPEEECVQDLVCIISKVNFHQFIAYLKAYCYKALFGFDNHGSTALHSAAKYGKSQILEWIVNELNTNDNSNNKINVNTQDFESGWTPLHKAVHYGRISCIAALLRNGSNLNIQDKDGKDVIDFINYDISPWLNNEIKSRNTKDISTSSLLTNHFLPTELYAWGVNENLNMGMKMNKNQPSHMEFFTSKKVYIKKVVLCKYHSLFLDVDGFLHTCGHGQGGRLGSGHEDFIIEPRVVKCEQLIDDVSAANDHSVVVTKHGLLMTCGRNHARVLGLNPPPDSQLIFGRVILPKNHRVIGCAAGNYHTAVWTDKSALFTFGTNAGQLGHMKGDVFVIQPRQVSSVYSQKDEVEQVCASDASTLVFTKSGNLFLLSSFVCRRILTNHLDVKKISVGGGLLDSNVLSQVKSNNVNRESMMKTNRIKEVRVLILKKTGELYSWRSEHSTIDVCKFAAKSCRKTPDFLDVELSKNGTTANFVTDCGRVYVATYADLYSKKKKKSATGVKELTYSSSFMDADSIQYFNVDSMLNAARTHTVVLGPKGQNGILLQRIPVSFLTNIPLIESSTDYKSTLSSLYEDNREVSDHIHDVTVQVEDRNGRVLASHQLHWIVLISRSSLFAQLYTKKMKAKNTSSSTQDVVVIEGVSNEVVDAVIRAMYGVDSNRDSGKRSVSKNAVLYVKGVTGPLAVTKQNLKDESLSKILGLFGISTDIFALPSRSSMPPHDCVIECGDGVVYNAHKCLLASRVPYFAALLSPWSSCMLSSNDDDDEITRLKVPTTSDIFRFVFDYLYTDLVDCFPDDNIILLLEVLACADLLLFNRCKQAVETKVVPLLTLKNVIEVSEISQTINATQLYEVCVEFACQNLSYLLYTTNFIYANDEFLNDMETYYRNHIPGVYNRGAPPSQDGPTLDDVPHVDEADICDEFVFPGRKLSVEKSTLQESLKKNKRKRKKSKNFSPLGGYLLSSLLDNEVNDDDDVITKMLQKPKTRQTSNITLPPPSAQSTVVQFKSDKVINIDVSTPQAPTSNVAPSSPTTPKSPITPKSPTSPKSPTKSTPPAVVEKSSGTSGNLVAASSVYASHFPSLENTEQIVVSSAKNKTTSVAVASSYKKLSQKQKKRLLQQQQEEKQQQQQNEQAQNVVVPNAWGVVKSTCPTPQVSPFASAPVPVPPQRQRTRTISFQSPPKSFEESLPTISPKKSSSHHHQGGGGGPWKQLPPHSPHQQTLQVANTSPNKSLHDIMLTEEKLNDEEIRLKKKPLSVIQMEEEAMNELRQHYIKENSCKSTKITVKRVAHHQAVELMKFLQ